MFKKVAMLIVVAGAVATAQAQAGEGGFNFNHDRSPPTWSHPTAAPEIDPASAMSAFTLLSGGLVMLRGRRTKK
jgi:hypothetical protein